MKSRNFLKPFAASVATLVAGSQVQAAPLVDTASSVSQKSSVVDGLVLAKANSSVELAAHGSHSSHASHSSHSSHSSSAH